MGPCQEHRNKTERTTWPFRASQVREGNDSITHRRVVGQLFFGAQHMLLEFFLKRSKVDDLPQIQAENMPLLK